MAKVTLYEATTEDGRKVCGHTHRSHDGAKYCNLVTFPVVREKAHKPKQESRATRCNNACSEATSAIEELNAFREELESTLSENDVWRAPTEDEHASYTERFQPMLDKVDAAKTDIESLKDEIEEVCDNMPEGLQSSQRYETLDETRGTLDTTVDNLSTLAQDTTLPAITAPATDWSDFVDELKSHIDDAESGISDAEGAEFPGMFG